VGDLDRAILSSGVVALGLRVRAGLSLAVAETPEGIRVVAGGDRAAFVLEPHDHLAIVAIRLTIL
jgi:hypothetical protein